MELSEIRGSTPRPGPTNSSWNTMLPVTMLPNRRLPSGRLHLWLREHGWLLELYALRKYGWWGYLKDRQCRSWANSCRNLIDWFPLIWRDRDFDHWYLTQLLAFKLERMAHHFQTHNVVVSSSSMARDCRIVAALLRRVEDDDYGPGEPITRENVLRWQQMRERDMRIACHILQRRYLYWWD